ELELSDRRVGSDCRPANFVRERIPDRTRPYDELTSIAVVDTDDLRHDQRRLGTGVCHDTEAGGQDRLHIVVAMELNEGRKFVEHSVHDLAFLLLICRLHWPALICGLNSGDKIIVRLLEVRRIDRRDQSFQIERQRQTNGNVARQAYGSRIVEGAEACLNTYLFCSHFESPCLNC